MDTARETSPLVEALRHPKVKDKVDVGVMTRPSTSVDHVIGVVEDAIERARRYHRRRSDLLKLYAGLQQAYPQHFLSNADNDTRLRPDHQDDEPYFN